MEQKRSVSKFPSADQEILCLLVKVHIYGGRGAKTIGWELSLGLLAQILNISESILDLWVLFNNSLFLIRLSAKQTFLGKALALSLATITEVYMFFVVPFMWYP